MTLQDLEEIEECWEISLQDALVGVVNRYSKTMTLWRWPFACTEVPRSESGWDLRRCSCDLPEMDQGRPKLFSYLSRIVSLLSTNRCILVRPPNFEMAAQLTETASYRAWIGRNGRHYTNRVPFRCWNTELIENASTAVAYDWVILDQTITTGVQLYRQDVQRSMEKIVTVASRTSMPGLQLSLKATDTMIRREGTPTIYRQNAGATKRAGLLPRERFSRPYERDWVTLRINSTL